MLMILIVNLLRKQKLYVGYGIIWLSATAGLMLMVSVPSLMELITRAVGALFPASALSLLAFVFIIVVLIFFSVKLTALSAQQAELIQVLGLREILSERQTSSQESDEAPGNAAS